MYTEDYYSILGVERNATAEEIKNAYRLMCKVHHPDAGGDETLMKLLNKAYITLSDEKQRAQYDRTYTENTNYKNAQNSYSPSETVTAFILEVDGSVSEKLYKKQSLKFDVSKYQDEDGILYIYNDVRKESHPHTVLKRYAWEYKYAYHNHSAQLINCSIFFERDGDKSDEVPLCNLPLRYTDYITKNGCLFVVIYKDSSHKFFNTYEQWKSECDSLNTEKVNRSISGIFKMVVISIFILILLGPAMCSYTETPLTSSPTPTPITETPPAHGTKMYNLPNTGKTSYIKFETKDMLSDYCYIKAVDAESGELVQAVFIDTSRNYKMTLPVGTYEIYYACGDNWYGYEDLFGSEGGYSYCDSSFELTYDTYYTVTLSNVTNGNMETEDVGFENFSKINYSRKDETTVENKNCRVNGCNNTRLWSYNCIDHQCAVVECDIPRTTDELYCFVHKDTKENKSSSTNAKNTQTPDCAYDNCSTSVFSGDLYCSRHTCNDAGCDNPISKGSSYCLEHKCRVSGCNNGLITNDEYCSSHECSDFTCSNRRSGYSSYCTEHKCANANCTSSKSFDSEYCYLHSDF